MAPFLPLRHAATMDRAHSRMVPWTSIRCIILYLVYISGLLLLRGERADAMPVEVSRLHGLSRLHVPSRNVSTGSIGLSSSELVENPYSHGQHRRLEQESDKQNKGDALSDKAAPHNAGSGNAVAPAAVSSNTGGNDGEAVVHPSKEHNFNYLLSNAVRESGLEGGGLVGGRANTGLPNSTANASAGEQSRPQDHIDLMKQQVEKNMERLEALKKRRNESLHSVAQGPADVLTTISALGSDDKTSKQSLGNSELAANASKPIAGGHGDKVALDSKMGENSKSQLLDANVTKPVEKVSVAESKGVQELVPLREAKSPNVGDEYKNTVKESDRKSTDQKGGHAAVGSGQHSNVSLAMGGEGFESEKTSNTTAEKAGNVAAVGDGNGVESKSEPSRIALNEGSAKGAQVNQAAEAELQGGDEEVEQVLEDIVKQLNSTLGELDRAGKAQNETEERLKDLEKHVEEHHVQEAVERMREDGLSRLVDYETGELARQAQSQFQNVTNDTLSRLRAELREQADPAVLHHDFALLAEVALLIATAALGGLAAHRLTLPVSLGYIFAGAVVGPSGLALVRNFVQVQTIALFGSLFVLFAHGADYLLQSRAELEPSLAFAGVCCLAGVALALPTLAFCCGFVTSLSEAAILGAAATLSSRTIVVEYLQEGGLRASELGRLLVHVATAQDVAMGFVMAAPAALAAPSTAQFFFSLARTLACYVLLFALLLLLSRRLVPSMFRHLAQAEAEKQKRGGEGPDSSVILLGMVSTCLGAALFTEAMGLSLETGAFFAGFAWMQKDSAKKTRELLQPLDSFFGSMYFAAVGMILSPMWVWRHLLEITLAVINLAIVKILVVMGVCYLFRFSSRQAWNAGVSLAQVGEFSLLFLSKAQSFDLVSRQVYLVFMAATAVHLGSAPLLKGLIRHRHKKKTITLQEVGHGPHGSDGHEREEFLRKV